MSEQWEITKLLLAQKRLREDYEMKQKLAREAEYKWRQAYFAYMDDFQALVDDAVAWRKWSALHQLVKAKLLHDEEKLKREICSMCARMVIFEK